MTEMSKILYCPHCKRRENFWVYSRGLYCVECGYFVHTRGEEKYLSNLAIEDMLREERRALSN